MSAYYANGVIAIPNVTGSIVITATAVASSAAYTNLADPTDSLWQTDFRLNSSGVATAQSGKTVCNAIACGKGDTIYFKGVTSFEVAGGDRIALYLASGVGDAISYTAALLENGEDNITGYLRKISEGYYAFHCNYAGSVSLRAAFTTPENAGDIIITRNEPIA